MKVVLATVISLAYLTACAAPFQDPEIHTSSKAEELGWNAGALATAFDHAKGLGSDTLLIITNGQIVGSYGRLDEPYRVHSIRKALLSALVGQHLGTGPGKINLDATLENLKIDDEPVPLKPHQRHVKVLHLIKSLSGINRSAAAEAGLMTVEKDERLGQGDNAPGTKWAYNNWDYNALTTVFEQQTGQTIPFAFLDGIAEPLELQDYSTEHVGYGHEPLLSRHRAASFRISGRDLARFGELYLAEGVWDGKRILPAEWVQRITTDYSVTGHREFRMGHGYLWWVPEPETGFPEGTYWASGLGRQALFVIPAWQTVIVHQGDTTPLITQSIEGAKSTGVSFGEALLELLHQCSDPARSDTAFCRENAFLVYRNFRRLIKLVIAARLP